MTLKEFLSLAHPRDKEVASTELSITMQPGMISFGGHFSLTDRTEIPIDIRKIGKSKCEQLSADIESMHRSTANSGQNKWNKATFNIDSQGQVRQQFVWDAQFETDNVNVYQVDGEITRRKWYWEEK
ncbi:MAG TPA: hypothetical protein VGD40_22090 [Chryseosolibacter sp.]